LNVGDILSPFPKKKKVPSGGDTYFRRNEIPFLDRKIKTLLTKAPCLHPAQEKVMNELVTPSVPLRAILGRGSFFFRRQTFLPVGRSRETFLPLFDHVKELFFN